MGRPLVALFVLLSAVVLGCSACDSGGGANAVAPSTFSPARDSFVPSDATCPLNDPGPWGPDHFVACARFHEPPAVREANASKESPEQQWSAVRVGMSLQAVQHALGRSGAQVGPASTFPDGSEVMWTFGNMFVRFHNDHVVVVIKNPLPPE